MTTPAYNHQSNDHELVITTAAITAATVRRILTEEFGYTVQVVTRGGAAARISDAGAARWVFVVGVEDAALMTGSR